jgi:hypothetical protein
MHQQPKQIDVHSTGQSLNGQIGRGCVAHLENKEERERTKENDQQMGVPQCSTMVQQWFNNGSTTMVQQQWSTTMVDNNGQQQWSTTMVNNNGQQQ